MIYVISRFFCFVFFKLFFRVKFYGRENIPRKGGVILASNHVSYLDPVAVGIACRRRLSYMAKQELFSNPFFSWFLGRLGAFPVKRNSADLSALKEAIRRVKKGGILLLFPEGSRQSGGISLNPQAGIGFLVEKINVPVIPVFVQGSENVLPKGTRFIRPAKITVRFGPQLAIERGISYQDIARKIMEDIKYLSFLS